MRVNMPVTGVERVMQEGEEIISTTDLRGLITHVNRAFIEISGFTEAELIGSPQNIVRHPDMPAEAFKDLWQTIQAGKPWVGMVKNRCKNGDHYWVEAHVTPIFRGGQATGFLSVRRRPSRDQVAAAETLYRQLREGKAKCLHPTGIKAWFNNASLRSRMLGSLGVLVGLTLILAATNLYSLRSSNQAIEAVHTNGVLAQRLANRIRNLTADNRTQVALALQHDPASPASRLHDHAISQHLDTIAENRTKVDQALAELQQLALPNGSRTTLEKAIAARMAFISDGLAPAVQALQSAQYLEAARILTTRMNPLYQEVDQATHDFLDQVVAQGEQAMATSHATYTKMWTLAVVVLLLALAAAVVAGIVLMRIIQRPLDQAMTVFRSIAEGRYDNAIPIRRRDEIGQVLEGLESMQTKLGFDVIEAKRVADENLRVRIALDNVSSNVMMADNDRKIVYVNKAVEALFHGVEADIKKQLPRFDAGKLLGASIDTFHKDPTHQAQLLATFTSTYKSTIHIGGRTMTVVANPVINDRGERLGAVVEWGDRTAEVAVEKEVADLVQAAAAGDFSQRIALSGKDGFFLQLAEGINKVVETSERGINDVAEVLRALAEGDLNRHMDGAYEGRFAELRDDTNATVERLKDIVAQIREATDAITTASREIAAGNTDLSARTESQAASLEETASAMDELTSTVKQNADNARQANQLALGASEVAGRGGEVVGQVVQTMGAIANASKKIADIISVIDGIAFQTNILALNAAVEAARAGEQGRGFAVVASEVRNLAQRSASAAKEIKQLISDSVDKVDNGHRLVDQAGATMHEVVQAVKRVTDIMGEITAASMEQSQGIEQVNVSIAQMDEMTQQNAALVEEAAAAAESLQDQANSLSRAVAMFKVASAKGRLPAPQQAAAVPAAPALPTRKRALPAAMPEEGEWEEF